MTTRHTLTVLAVCVAVLAGALVAATVEAHRTARVAVGRVCR